jgi:hypothetical protein
MPPKKARKSRKKIEEIEDRIDIREALKALKDPRRIPFEQVRKELGLDKKRT